MWLYAGIVWYNVGVHDKNLIGLLRSLAEFKTSMHVIIMIWVTPQEVFFY